MDGPDSQRRPTSHTPSRSLPRPSPLPCPPREAVSFSPASQRTRPTFTAPASYLRLLPTMQPVRQLRESLSLGSFAKYFHPRQTPPHCLPLYPQMTAPLLTSPFTLRHRWVQRLSVKNLATITRRSTRPSAPFSDRCPTIRPPPTREAREASPSTDTSP